MPSRPDVGGRPTKDNPDKRLVILQAIQNKMPLYLAADLALIHRSTLSRWLAEDAGFAAQVAEAKAIAAGDLINRVISDSNGAWKVLKNLQPSHFKDEPTPSVTNQFVISLGHPNGNATTISFGNNPQLQPASGAVGHTALTSSDTPGDIGDTGGEEHTRGVLATNKNSNGS